MDHRRVAGVVWRCNAALVPDLKSREGLFRLILALLQFRHAIDPMSHSDYGLCHTSKSRIAAEMMPSTHEAVKGWLMGDPKGWTPTRRLNREQDEFGIQFVELVRL